MTSPRGRELAGIGCCTLPPAALPRQTGRLPAADLRADLLEQLSHHVLGVAPRHQPDEPALDRQAIDHFPAAGSVLQGPRPLVALEAGLGDVVEGDAVGWLLVYFQH